MLRSPFFWLILSLIALLLLTTLAPAEKSLGTNVRVVYLHGVWVWAALAAFLLAGIVGSVGLILRSDSIHGWSRALGRTGLTFWITYLPISILAMQANWNGLFLTEPRWRMAMIFAITGLLLQAGLTLLGRPVWASIGNIIYLVALFMAIRTTENVMHPPSPILNSNAPRIQLYFGVLLLLTFFAAWQTARIWHLLEKAHPEENRLSQEPSSPLL